MTKEAEIRALIEGIPTWYHRFEVYPGVVTPGIHPVDASKTLDAMGLEPDLAGKRILEIGTWDGPYAFELASRGGEVVALDIHDPARTGFNLAKSITNSDVRYVQTSVYDMNRVFTDEFDIVVFMGVYYHLKNPLLAFDRIHGVLKKKGRLFVEGEVFSHYAENHMGRVPSFIFRWLLPFVAHSKVPLVLFYPGKYKNDESNWHIPNAAALEAWLVASGFKIREMRLRFGDEVVKKNARKIFVRGAVRAFRYLDRRQRIIVLAEKTENAPTREHVTF